MPNSKSTWFLKGLKDGIPIALGYLAVAFTLGIAATQNAHLTPFQAMLSSAALNASAGEFVGFTLIAAGSSYLEVGIMEMVANARYLLMSCSLSQKLPPDLPMRHRLLVSFDLTDEIFGISIAVPGYLNPYYTYGAVAVAWPGWAIGTLLGALLGNVLPAQALSALGVALYGMFIAIIVPPARKNRVIAILIVVSMALSFLVANLTWFDGISDGMKTILLTVIISAAAAIFFPVKEDKRDAA